MCCSSYKYYRSRQHVIDSDKVKLRALSVKSMSGRGNRWYNVPMERFFRNLKNEVAPTKRCSK